MPSIVADLGRVLFHGVALRPAGPVGFGVVDQKPVFMLPGNPVSAQVTFALLVAPALAALRGDEFPGPHLVSARIEDGAPREGGRGAFRPAEILPLVKGRIHVRLLPWNGSGDFVNFSRADALVFRPARAPAARAGDPVEVLLL